MAIEREDWFVVGGAAAGGILLGAVAANILAPAPAPPVELAHRRYRHAERPGFDAERGGIVVDVYHPGDGGIAVTTLPGRFEGVGEAADWTDSWARENELRPVGPWATDVLEDVVVEAAPSAVRMEPAIAGKRRRRA